MTIGELRELISDLGAEIEVFCGNSTIVTDNGNSVFDAYLDDEDNRFYIFYC
jgi:ribose 5-phosphate isomerase